MNLSSEARNYNTLFLSWQNISSRHNNWTTSHVTHRWRWAPLKASLRAIRGPLKALSPTKRP